MRAEWITVSTVGLGADVNRALLQSIANLGGGRSYLSDPRKPDEALLASAAELTGGEAEPTPARLFDAGGETIRAHEELWPWLLYFALGLFVLDLLFRRVRLFDRGFKRPARR